MKVLLIHSGNSVNDSADYSFVKEQGDALEKEGLTVSYFGVKGKGFKGYLSNFSLLKQRINQESPDILHAHFGFCGALAVLQHKVPVVITFHNGETLTTKGKIISSIASFFSSYNIFVAQHIKDKLFTPKRRYVIQPCGINIKDFPICPQDKAIEQFGLSNSVPNILFGGSYSNQRKNAPLAKQAIALLNYPVNLIEMKGWTREQVPVLLCACDLLLIPTKSEGSPQVVKEAMACNCPVVATNVADIPWLLSEVKNSHTTSFDPYAIADKINEVIKCGERSNGRERVIQLGLDNKIVAKRIIEIYCKVLSNGRKKAKA